jgi:hypothetical protein
MSAGLALEILSFAKEISEEFALNFQLTWFHLKNANVRIY